MDAYPKAWQVAMRLPAKTHCLARMRLEPMIPRPFIAVTAVSLLISLLWATSAWADTPQTAVSPAELNAYIASVARAWEPYTTPDGRVEDPLDPADTGDNYGVIMLADVMLKEAKLTGDSGLEGTGERILGSALTLPIPTDPFNLLAIAAVIHDGERGLFPASVWEALQAPLMWRAGQIEQPAGEGCLTEPGCYGNWRLVWAAGAALLTHDQIEGEPGSLAVEPTAVGAQIRTDLGLAVAHAGTPLESVAGGETREHRKQGAPIALTSSPAGGIARELSDPGSEPVAYELFSTFMLESIGENDPQAITPAVAKLRRQADRYALEMMAPDGQLSLSGRSLDQSWVQAAAAALGARRAALEPSSAPAWRAYAQRAVAYLQAAYPLRPNGLLPIIPGLEDEWSPSIMDRYAALNQYEGLTLWLLSDALAKWPSTQAQQAPLPADDRELLVDDLASSGLVWGRAGGVWWELAGRATSSDPRAAQGLVGVKVRTALGDEGTGLGRSGALGWRDLLALRPIHGGQTSAWKLRYTDGTVATPVFTGVRGTGGRTLLLGRYRAADGRVLARVGWTLSATESGVRLSMTMPAKTTLHTTVWLAPERLGARLLAPGATIAHGACTVSASGGACPATIYWRNQRTATLEID
jgi:hypothetical protein